MLNQVANTLGQCEANSTYPLKTPIKAFVTNVEKEKYDQNTGKLKSQKLYLRDEDGDIAEVFLKGNFKPLPKGGDWYYFLVWPFKPDDTNKIYLMCWIQNQNTPTSPPQAAQGAKLPPGIDTQSQIMDMAERFLKAIETLVYPNITQEQVQPNPEYEENPEPPEDDDTIPF